MRCNLYLERVDALFLLGKHGKRRLETVSLHWNWMLPWKGNNRTLSGQGPSLKRISMQVSLDPALMAMSQCVWLNDVLQWNWCRAEIHWMPSVLWVLWTSWQGFQMLPVNAALKFLLHWPQRREGKWSKPAWNAATERHSLEDSGRNHHRLAITISGLPCTNITNIMFSSKRIVTNITNITNKIAKGV